MVGVRGFGKLAACIRDSRLLTGDVGAQKRYESVTITL
jgi:hypothetical protein